MYSLKNINQIRRKLSLLEYISWKSVALLSVILEARIELIYLQTSRRWFHLLLHSKNPQHQSPSVDNYCIYTIQYSLFDYCWMIAAEHIPQSHYLHCSKKKEDGTNLLGSLQLNKLSISELSLSVALSVTLDILENHRYLLWFCVLAVILLKKIWFLNVVMS